MMLLPETPQDLLKKLKDVEALKSLKFYRNCNENKVEAINNELEAMRKNIFNIPDEEVGMKECKTINFGIFKNQMCNFS